MQAFVVWHVDVDVDDDLPGLMTSINRLLMLMLMFDTVNVRCDRENARYVELVESGRSFAKMEERKRKKQEQEGANGKVTADGAEVGQTGVADSHRRIRRRFKQSSPVADVGGGGSKGLDADVLRSVFGASGESRKPNGL